MFNFETVTPVGHEAERVATAFYRFLEKAAPSDADASFHTEIAGNLQRSIIRLWSESAVDDFRIYLDSFSTPKPFGMLREFGRAS